MLWAWALSLSAVGFSRRPQLPNKLFVFRLVMLCSIVPCSHVFRAHSAFCVVLG